MLPDSPSPKLIAGGALALSSLIFLQALKDTHNRKLKFQNILTEILSSYRKAREKELISEKEKEIDYKKRIQAGETVREDRAAYEKALAKYYNEQDAERREKLMQSGDLNGNTKNASNANSENEQEYNGTENKNSDSTPKVQINPLELEPTVDVLVSNADADDYNISEEEIVELPLLLLLECGNLLRQVENVDDDNGDSPSGKNSSKKAKKYFASVPSILDTFPGLSTSTAFCSLVNKAHSKITRAAFNLFPGISKKYLKSASMDAVHLFDELVGDKCILGGNWKYVDLIYTAFLQNQKETLNAGATNDYDLASPLDDVHILMKNENSNPQDGEKTNFSINSLSKHPDFAQITQLIYWYDRRHDSVKVEDRLKKRERKRDAKFGRWTAKIPREQIIYSSVALENKSNFHSHIGQPIFRRPRGIDVTKLKTLRSVSKKVDHKILRNLIEKTIDNLRYENVAKIPVAELKKHNNKDSCWILIDDKVYDVTPFLDIHPGGDELITQAAGGWDATALFEQTHGEGLRYSLRILNNFFIGFLDKESVDDKDNKIQMFDSGLMGFDKWEPSAEFLKLLRQVTGVLHENDNVDDDEEETKTGVEAIVSGWFLSKKRNG